MSGVRRSARLEAAGSSQAEPTTVGDTSAKAKPAARDQEAGSTPRGGTTNDGSSKHDAIVVGDTPKSKRTQNLKRGTVRAAEERGSSQGNARKRRNSILGGGGVLGFLSSCASSFGFGASSSKPAAEASPPPSERELEEPESMLACPLTLEMLVDPVVAADGQTYERKAIESWLRAHATSPLTNLPLTNKTLIPNVLVRRLVDEHRQKKPRLARQQQEAESTSSSYSAGASSSSLVPPTVAPAAAGCKESAHGDAAVIDLT